MNMIDDVRHFHATMGVPIEELPTLSTIERRLLRMRLIQEEAGETAQALIENDLAAIADGVIDLLYVTIGTAIELGLPIEALWAEVHRTNVAKAGGPIREDGKQLKPPGWTPPDIAGVLTIYGYTTGSAEPTK